jgi:hypothetical protein
MARLDTEIDRLYQLPLTDFTAARNALARREAGSAADIRALAKPTVPAWAVNQLYWKERPVYERLLERAADLRSTHNAALRGRRTDLRGASRAHDEAFDEALKATLALLSAEGHPVTDATRQAIATTLRALPGAEPPGRLTRQLEPIGFQTLGIPAPEGKVRPPAPKPKAEPGGARGADAAERERAAVMASAREALAEASRAAREAEGVVRREQFESARASRAAVKALDRVTDAEAAVREAQASLEEARKAASAAERERDEARARGDQAAEQLKDARKAEQAARKALDRAQR